MYYVYIIKSLKNLKWYIGSTNNIELRLIQHNAGKTKSTKPHIPYKLIYSEAYSTKTDALKRERQIKKSGIIRKQLKEAIENNNGPIV